MKYSSTHIELLMRLMRHPDEEYPVYNKSRVPGLGVVIAELTQAKLISNRTAGTTLKLRITDHGIAVATRVLETIQPLMEAA
jgi:hypothetical protein